MSTPSRPATADQIGLFSKLAYFLDRRSILIAAGLLVLTVIGALLEGLSLGLITPFIGVLSNPSLIHSEKHLEWMYRAFHATSDRQFLLRSAVLILVTFVVKNLYLLALNYLQFLFTYNRLVQLAKRLFATYLGSPYLFHLSRNTAELVRNLSADVVIVFHHVIAPLVMLISEFIVSLLILAILIAADPPIALTAAFVIGGAAYLFYRTLRARLGATGKKEQYHSGQSIKWINQGLGSIKEATILGRQSFSLERFGETTHDHSRALLFYQVVNQSPKYFIETLAVTGMLLVAIALLAQNRTDTLLPTLTLFALGAFRLMPSLNRIVGLVAGIKYHLSSVDVVYNDLTQLRASDVSAVPTQAFAFKKQIEIRDVSFGYPNSAVPVVRNISLTIPKGTSVAFVGPSGAGKTTVVDIILGLLEPLSGSVMVDDVDMRLNVGGWQRNIGYIPQTIYVMDDTIRRNVAFGLPDERISDEQVWNALRLAQLETFVRNSPMGLDSQAGERGLCLSGGERQRIGIARALYMNPDVLVLDEATSSLDTETESEITESIERLGKIKTLIIIAHRLTTVRNCDRIYLIREGRFVGRVSYADLVAHGFGLDHPEPGLSAG